MPAIKDLSDEELLKEWRKWDKFIREAPGWGASLAAADEFRRECRQELSRRYPFVDKTKEGTVFYDHTCWCCNDGEKPERCRATSPRMCDNLRARND